MEIHLITQGSYSDYSIVGAFLDKGEAESVCNHKNGPGSGYIDWRVETFEIAEGEQIPIHVLRLGWDYFKDRPRNYGPEGRENPERVSVHFPFEGYDFEACKVTENKERGWAFLEVQGTDFDRVRKVYSDRKAELLAHFEGLS